MAHSNIKLKNTSSLKKNLRKAAFILVCIFVAAQTQAKYIDLTEAAEKKKTIVSGVLNPPSISINGIEIEQKPASYLALLINGEAVKTTDAGGLKTFYAVIEGDQALLQWKASKNNLIPILEVSYPAVVKMELKHTEFTMQFNEQTKKVKYDGEEIDAKNSKIKVRSTSEWIKTPHTLELLSEQNIGRIYNLDFRKYKEDLLTQASWTLSLGDAQLQGNNRPAALGVSSRILNQKNYSHELFAGVAHTSYAVGAGTAWAHEIEQRTIELKYKWGYNPFQTNSGDINYRRLTLGLHASLINYHRNSDYKTLWMDGYDDTSADIWFHQGGYFVRWEPLQYGNFGFSLSIDHRVYGSQNSIMSDSTLKSFGLSYYFDPAVLKRIISRQPLEF